MEVGWNYLSWPLRSDSWRTLPASGNLCNDSLTGAMSKVYVTKVEDTYRLAGTRISLDSLIYLYREGISPEGMWKATRR